MHPAVCLSTLAVIPSSLTSTDFSGPHGENLAAGYPSASAAVDAWYGEISDYDFSNPGFSVQYPRRQQY